MSRENNALRATSEKPVRPSAESNENESTARAVAALERAASIGFERDVLERRGTDRLASIRDSVTIPEDQITPAQQRVEAELGAVAAEAGAEMAKSKKALTGTIRTWADKHRKAAMFLLAAALAHAPVFPQTRAAFENVVEMVKGMTDWEKPNMVIHPQTVADRKAVTDRMYERGARSDAKGTEAYKEGIREKMERGEPVSFKRMYLDLERLGGEDPEEVKKAEEKLDQLIASYGGQMNGRMDEAFVRRVVMERFGSDQDYVWGQASLTKRMTTGKRNCVSFAREQQVIFEGLIAQLPPEQQSRYEVGLTMEKQHEIATVTVKRADGSIEATYLLQPPIDKIANGTDRAGSPNVSLETVKKAIVSKEPVRVAADAKGQEIPSSPDLDIITDQPVGLNLKVEGRLRGSDYVQEVAQERGVKPVPQEPERLVGVQELEVMDQQEGPEAVALAWGRGKDNVTSYDANILISLTDLNNPTPEAIGRLKPASALEDELSKIRTVQVAVGDTSHWSEASLAQLMRMPHQNLEVNMGADGKIPDNLIKALGENVPDRHLKSLHVTGRGAEDFGLHLPPAQLSEILHAPGLKSVEFDYIYLKRENQLEETRIFAQAPAIDIFVNFETLTEHELPLLKQSKATFHVRSNAYIKLLEGVRPGDVLDVPNIKPDYPRANIGEASCMYKLIKQHRPHHPVLREIKLFFKNVPGFSQRDLAEMFP